MPKRRLTLLWSILFVFCQFVLSSRSSASPATASPYSVFGVEIHPGWVNQTSGGTTVAGRASQASVRWVRYNGIRWPTVEPQKGSYNWAALASVEKDLAALSAQGLTPVVVIRGTPSWAQREGKECGPIRQQNLGDFANFVEKLVLRYRSAPYNVKYWEIWNEPDWAWQDAGTQSWQPGCLGDAYDPANFGGDDYASMLAAVYPRVKAADPTAKVVLGGLMYTCDQSDPAGGGGRNCAALRFLEGVLRNNGSRYFDILAFHSYTFWAPDVSIDWDLFTGGQGLFLDKGGLFIDKINRIRATLAQYRVSKPIFMNEGALLCHPNQPGCGTPSGDLLRAHANYVFRLYARGWAHGLHGVYWYTLQGPGWRHSGLLEKDTQLPRPGYQALKFLAGKLNGSIYAGRLSPLPISTTSYEGYRFCASTKEYRIYWTNHKSVNISLPLPSGNTYDTRGNLIAPSNVVSFEPKLLEINSPAGACRPAALWGFDLSRGQSPLSDSGSDLTSIERYARSGGPCYRKAPGTCRFDTRTIFNAGNGHRIESITTPDGKFWHFDLDAPGSPGWGNNGTDNTRVSRYMRSNGPCRGKTTGKCRFDTRTIFYASNGHRIESITTPDGKYWHFDIDAPGLPGWGSNGNDNTWVERYRRPTGPCYGKTTGTCRFDTRTFFYSNGHLIESITTPDGRFWHFDIDAPGVPSWGSNGRDNTTVDRYVNNNGPCHGRAKGTCRFGTRVVYKKANGILLESITDH